MSVGFNADPKAAAPNTGVVSVKRKFNIMYDKVFNEIVNGTFEAKLYAFGIADEGMILSDWHGWDQKLPEAKATLDKMIADFKAGTAKVG